jgi:hypothetical protein
MIFLVGSVWNVQQGGDLLWMRDGFINTFFGLSVYSTLIDQ